MVWVVLQGRRLRLSTNSSIARLARAALLVNRRPITFDAAVAEGDTGPGTQKDEPGPPGAVHSTHPNSRRHFVAPVSRPAVVRVS